MVLVPPALAVGLAEAHFPYLRVDFEDLVAVGGAVLFPVSGEVTLGSTGHYMRLLGSIGLAGAGDGLDSAGPALSTHSYLGSHPVAAHSPIRPGHSGHCPNAHCRPGRSRSRSIAGRTGGRTGGHIAGHNDCHSPAADAVFVAAFPGHSVVVVVVVVVVLADSCRTAAGRPFRRCWWGKDKPTLSMDVKGL